MTTLNNKNKYLKINFQYKKAYKKKIIQNIHPTLKELNKNGVGLSVTQPVIYSYRFFFIFQWCGLAYDDECISYDYSYGLSLLLLLLLLLFIMRHFLFNNIHIFYIFQIFYKI